MKIPNTKIKANPPVVATTQRGIAPSVQRLSHETAGRPSERRSGIRPSGPLSLLIIQKSLVKEVTGEQHSHDKNQQQAQIKACAV